jgi:hypothetical protein
MSRLMDRIRRALGYEVLDTTEHDAADKRLEAQKVRISALDARIQAQNAAPVKTPRRRATDA